MKRQIMLSIVLTVILLLASGLVSAEEKAVNNIITKISIEGNKHTTSEEILSVIKTKVGDPFDREKIKKDLQLIYELGYFRNPTASFKNYNGGIEVIFQTVENPVITDFQINGELVIERSTFIDWLGIEKGKVLNVNELSEGMENVKKKYQEKGYVLAGFIDVNVDEEGILILDFNIGYLNKVVLKGNEKTKDFVILRELDLEEGQILNIKEVQQGYQNLERLRYFKKIQPRFEMVDREKNTVNLVINLTEEKTGQFQAGAGLTNKDSEINWIGFISVKERNLLGNGQTLGFEWEFGDSTNYSLNFHEPWLMGTPTSFGISLYDKTTESTGIPETRPDIETTYTETRTGGSISVGHAITESWDGNVRLKIENSSTSWPEDYDDNGTPVDLTANNESGSTRSLTFRATRNTTNHPLHPTDGGIDIASIEYAGQVLGGDYDFTKYNLDVRRFYSGFKEGHAWGIRLKTGISDGGLPLQEQYRLGGSESLRGYENSIYGNNMALLQVEYRFPIADKFTGVIFTDHGNAWESVDAMTVSDLNSSIGLGVRLDTYIGQIRLDYGWNEDHKGMPHFSIGHTF